MNNTVCGTKQSKLWGWTQCLYKGTTSETHRLYIDPDLSGKSSKHKHNNKWNRFFITSGSLKVKVWTEIKEQKYVLQEGQYIDIAPGTYHQFLINDSEECQCLEIYWTDQIDSEDIDRTDPAVYIYSPITITDKDHDELQKAIDLKDDMTQPNVDRFTDCNSQEDKQ